jgi:hypothetical protein
VGLKHVVDDETDGLREDELGEGADNRRAESREAKKRVGAGVFPDAAEGFHKEVVFSLAEAFPSKIVRDPSTSSG